MSKKKDARILGIRLDESEALTLAEIETATTLTPVSIGRAAITAVIRRWKIDQELVLPFHIVTSAELATLPSPAVITSLPKPTAPSPVKTGGSSYPFPADEHQLRVAEDAPAPRAAKRSA
jgi:hypothetical protein